MFSVCDLPVMEQFFLVLGMVVLSETYHSHTLKRIDPSPEDDKRKTQFRVPTQKEFVTSEKSSLIKLLHSEGSKGTIRLNQLSSKLFSLLFCYFSFLFFFNKNYKKYFFYFTSKFEVYFCCIKIKLQRGVHN